MQTLKKCSGSGIDSEVVGGHFGIASETNTNNSINIQSEETKSLWQILKNDNGTLIVKSKKGIYYIRHDIIFAKAGDVFFMPRKVPADFKIEDETILTNQELEQFEAMSE